MRIKWITDPQRFLALREEWNALVHDSHADALFMRHEWLTAWWNAFGQASDLHVLVVFNDGALVGAAPLMGRAGHWHRLPVRKLTFMSSGVTPRSYILARGNDPAVIGEVLLALQGTSPNWDVVELNDVPADVYNNVATQAAFRRCSPRAICEPSRLSPYIDLRGTYEDFLALRSANTRSRYRRAWKRVSAAGSLELRKLTSNEEVMAALDDVFLVSARSWKGDIGTDMAATKASRNFYTEFANIGSHNGWVIIWMLYLNDEPVAMQFHVLYGGRVHLLRTDFDKQYNDLSPGTALEARILEDYFSSDLLEYDMCGMNYNYKLKLTSLARPHMTISLYNSKSYSLFLYYCRRHLAPALKRVLPHLRQADAAVDKEQA